MWVMCTSSPKGVNGVYARMDAMEGLGTHLSITVRCHAGGSPQDGTCLLSSTSALSSEAWAGEGQLPGSCQG